MKPHEKTIEPTYQQELLKVSKDAGLSFLFTVSGLVITYSTTLLITRVLGAADFGVFALAQTILLSAIPIAALGLNHSVLRFTSLYDGRDEPERIKGVLRFALKGGAICGVLLTALLLIMAPWLQDFFGWQNLSSAIRIIVIALPLAVLMEMLLAGLQGLRYVSRQTFVRTIIQQGVRLMVVSLFFLIGLRLVGVLWATVIGMASALVVGFYLLKKKFSHFRYANSCVVEKGEIIRFSTPMFFNNLLQRGSLDLPVLLLGYFLAEADVGVYAVAFRLALLVSLPLAAVNLIFAPTISNLYGRGDKETLARLFKTVTKWVFTLSLCTGLALILFAKPILSVFGAEFVSGAVVLVVLVLAQMVNAGVGSVGYMLSMTGRPGLNLTNTAAQFAVTLAVGILCIPQFGVAGAGVAMAVGLAIANLARVIQVFVIEHIHPYSSAFGKPLIAGLISVAIILGLRAVMSTDGITGTLLLLMLFVLVFSVSLIALRLNEDDQAVINSIRRRLRWA